MLLLVTIGLVLAGLVLLIVGFVQDSLSYIFVSIACAAVAAIALIVFGRLSRRRSLQIALDGGSAKLAPERQHAPARRSQVEVPTTTSRSRAPEAQSPVERLAEMATARSMAARREPDVTVAEEEEPLRERADWAPAPATPTAPIPAATTSYREPEPEWQPGGQWDEDDEWGEEVVFPIEDYDELRVAEIMPLLTELEPDELEEVRDRESTGKDRSTIIFRIDELLGREPVEAAPTPRPAPVPPPAPALSRRATAFPIPRYDDLRVSDVLPLLADLDAIGLERVRAHETALKDRATIVQRVDDLLGRGRAGVGEPAAAPGRIPARLVPTAAPKPAAIPAPTRKRAASPAPARAMPTKRRAAAKAAPGPTAKAAAGRKAAATAPAPTRKAAATTGKAAAPAQTRAASPAPGKGAKRAAPAAAKKTAPAPVKRAAPAAKKTTKAAAPVRRAAPAAGKATPARKAAKKR